MFSMISRIWRPIRDGFKGFVRHGAMALSSSVAVTITLIIIGIFGVFMTNVGRFTEGLEQSVQISVKVDYDYEAASEEDRISLAIAAIPGVHTVTYSSKADEFEYYINSFNDEKMKEAYAPFRDDNPMHDAFYVEVSDGTQLENIAAQIENIEGVEEVNFGGLSAVKMVAAMRSIRFGGTALALALSLLAIFLIQNTIKLTIMARADEIAIMRNVGARNGYIRAPFVIEGMIIGIVGALIPIALIFFGYQYIYRITGGYVISRMFSLIEPFPYLWQVCGVLLGISILVGLIGSFLSVSKYLRWKR